MRFIYRLTTVLQQAITLNSPTKVFKTMSTRTTGMQPLSRVQGANNCNTDWPRVNVLRVCAHVTSFQSCSVYNIYGLVAVLNI